MSYIKGQESAFGIVNILDVAAVVVVGLYK